MRAVSLDMKLIFALRYPVGRPHHAERLEWYCNTENMPDCFKYIAFTRPTVKIGERAVQEWSKIDKYTILQWATNNRRLKIFSDVGVDLLVFSESDNAQKIDVEVVQVKLSDKSNINGKKAKEIIKKLTKGRDDIAEKLKDKFSSWLLVKRPSISVHMSLWTTWNMSDDVRWELESNNVTVTHRAQIKWPDPILDFVQREGISWLS
eukprot:gene10579-11723_t